MNLSMGQGLALILFGIVMIVVLLKILSLVHHQSKHVKELEMRMKAMEGFATGPENDTQPDTAMKESEE
jgi:hypothetical protein